MAKECQTLVSLLCHPENILLIFLYILSFYPLSMLLSPTYSKQEPYPLTPGPCLSQFTVLPWLLRWTVQPYISSLAHPLPAVHPVCSSTASSHLALLSQGNRQSRWALPLLLLFGYYQQSHLKNQVWISCSLISREGKKEWCPQLGKCEDTNSDFGVVRDGTVQRPSMREALVTYQWREWEAEGGLLSWPIKDKCKFVRYINKTNRNLCI